MAHPKFNRRPSSYLRDIPSFVAKEKSVEAFGLQWLIHKKTQLDSFTGLTITQDRLKRMLGPLYYNLDGKVMLEVGCGAGRFTEVLIKNNLFLTSFDLSIAVLANYENNRNQNSLRILQASIADLPFDAEQFDIVFCPGVIQHTPDPTSTIQNLYSHVKPGGWLVFDQYRYNFSSFMKITWLLRLLLKRTTPEFGLAFTNLLVKFWLPIHKKASNNRLIEILLFRISPITSHYSGYPEMSEAHQKSWAQLNTHDNLTDYYKKCTTMKALKTKIKKLGAIHQFFCIMPYTIEVRCQKPTIGSNMDSSDNPTISDLRKSKITSG